MVVIGYYEVDDYNMSYLEFFYFLFVFMDLGFFLEFYSVYFRLLYEFLMIIGYEYGVIYIVDILYFYSYNGNYERLLFGMYLDDSDLRGLVLDLSIVSVLFFNVGFLNLSYG